MFCALARLWCLVSSGCPKLSLLLIRWHVLCLLVYAWHWLTFLDFGSIFLSLVVFVVSSWLWMYCDVFRCSSLASVVLDSDATFQGAWMSKGFRPPSLQIDGFLSAGRPADLLLTVCEGLHLNAARSRRNLPTFRPQFRMCLPTHGAGPRADRKVAPRNDHNKQQTRT